MLDLLALRRVERGLKIIIDRNLSQFDRLETRQFVVDKYTKISTRASMPMIRGMLEQVLMQLRPILSLEITEEKVNALSHEFMEEMISKLFPTILEASKQSEVSLEELIEIARFTISPASRKMFLLAASIQQCSMQLGAQLAPSLISKHFNVNLS